MGPRLDAAVAAYSKRNKYWSLLPEDASHRYPAAEQKIVLEIVLRIGQNYYAQGFADFAMWLTMLISQALFILLFGGKPTGSLKEIVEEYVTQSGNTQTPLGTVTWTLFHLLSYMWEEPPAKGH